ncbi:hypothetical protein Hamer_G013608 [Homarus americanus]|uniref:Uncharacterized protein n=1 Tax=Homarus americanus TaxID=6706 RepID=A0A8J5K4P5_HOMAM|nr:hypothetical protein Hamer_G013608 [Homarus americanus]
MGPSCSTVREASELGTRNSPNHAHDSHSCPHWTLSSRIASDASNSRLPPPTASDTSHWKCHEPGVNVWHGCTRRLTATPASPPPSPYVSLHTTTDNTLSSLVETQQTVITSVTTLTEKLDAFISRLEGTIGLLPPHVAQHKATPVPPPLPHLALVRVLIHPYPLLRPRRPQPPLLTPIWTSPLSRLVTILPSLRSTVLPTSRTCLTFSLVNFTHNFHSYYVSRPHIKRRFEYYAWTLDERILQAEKKMVEDGVSFQGDRPLTVSTSTSHPEMI